MMPPAVPPESATDNATHQEASRWPIVSEIAQAEIAELLKTGNISLDAGRFERLETDLCRGFDVKRALLTCNGTSAAFSAFHAIGLNPGDEIVAPALTHWATALPALHFGCRINFADSASDSLGITAPSVQQAVTPNTRAVVACHLYGNPLDAPAIREFCDQQGLYFIEDISHAPGATIAGRPVGSFGHLAFSSMQAAKILAGGEAGFLLTNNEDLYSRAVELAHPKRISRLLSMQHPYQGVGLGFKFRPSVLQVVLAHDMLRRLEQTNTLRGDMFNCLLEALGDTSHLTAPRMIPGAKRVYWEYELILSEPSRRTRVLRDLQTEAIIAAPCKLEFLPELPHFIDSTHGADRVAEYPQARRLKESLLVIRAFSTWAPATAKRLGMTLRQIVEQS